MSCPFFENRYSTFGWNPYCLKKDDRIPSDTYDCYCKNYNYSNCPIYEGGGSSGGCYLTSACVIAKNLPDDCYELEVLRGFRDGWMRKTNEREKDVQEYYDIAPQIVSAINKSRNPLRVYEIVYEEIVKPCVKLIEKKEYDNAFTLYKQSVLILKEEYFIKAK